MTFGNSTAPWEHAQSDINPVLVFRESPLSLLASSTNRKWNLENRKFTSQEAASRPVRGFQRPAPPFNITSMESSSHVFTYSSFRIDFFFSSHMQYYRSSIFEPFLSLSLSLYEACLQCLMERVRFHHSQFPAIVLAASILGSAAIWERGGMLTHRLSCLSAGTVAKHHRHGRGCPRPLPFKNNELERNREKCKCWTIGDI